MRLFAGVGADVDGEGASLNEGLLAAIVGAVVGSFVGVNAIMPL